MFFLYSFLTFESSTLLFAYIIYLCEVDELFYTLAKLERIVSLFTCRSKDICKYEINTYVLIDHTGIGLMTLRPHQTNSPESSIRQY